MIVPIHTKYVILVGPLSTGKTTLAKKINNESKEKSIVISRDDIISKLDKNKRNELVKEFEKEIREAISSNYYDQIILDTLNIKKAALYKMLFLLLEDSDYFRRITLLKMNLPFYKNLEYSVQSNKNITKEYLEFQRMIYESSKGSLRTHFPVNKEFIISDPEKVKLTFDL